MSVLIAAVTEYLADDDEVLTDGCRHAKKRADPKLTKCPFRVRS
jgi:hypothetical protein